MNNKIKLVRLVVAATFGSLLWAGCASPDRDYATSERNRPVDLTKYRADTHPEWGTGIDRESAYGTINVPVDNGAIYEGAGAERIRP